MMLGRTITSRALPQVRALHTTRPVHGFMDWFSLNKEKKAKAEEKPLATSEVMKKVENDEKLATKVDKVEFIGLIKNPKDLLTTEQRLKGFSIDHWLSTKKVENEESLDKILIETYESISNKKVNELKDINLDSLQVRFQYTLKVQEETGYIIPDYILTKACNALVLRDYFVKTIFSGRILKKDPEHLSHTELSYNAPNITVTKHISDNIAKKKYKKLLKTAKKAQKERAQELLSSS